MAAVILREHGWVYGTKVTDKDGKAYRGFQWPAELGEVTCPDWNPEPVCSGGLHFFEDGTGDLSAATTSEDSQWRLVRAKVEDLVRLDRKVKAKAVEVMLIGTRDEVFAAMVAIAPGKAVHYSTLTGGNRSTLTGGDYSTLTGGDYSTLTGGNRSTLTGGNRSTLTGGERGIIQIEWWDGKRKRLVIAYVGEEGVEPQVAYKLDQHGKFVRA